MPTVRGSLKTNELKLQGTEGVDFRLKVEDDEFNIKRGNTTLMTVGVDEDQILNGTDIGADQISIKAPVTFEENVHIKKDLQLGGVSLTGSELDQLKSKSTNVDQSIISDVSAKNPKINWNKKSLAYAMQQRTKVLPMSVNNQGSENEYYNKSKVSVKKYTDADGVYHPNVLEPQAEEIWEIPLEIHQCPIPGTGMEKESAGLNIPPTMLNDKVITEDMVNEMIKEANDLFSGDDIYNKYYPDPRSSLHKNKSIENGIEYFNDLDVRSKIADCQIKFVALSNSYLLPRDPTDCYRAYCSQTEDDHDDPNIAFSNGSQIVTVTNGISNYFPKLQYRDALTTPSLY